MGLKMVETEFQQCIYIPNLFSSYLEDKKCIPDIVVKKYKSVLKINNKRNKFLVIAEDYKGKEKHLLITLK